MAKNKKTDKPEKLYCKKCDTYFLATEHVECPVCQGTLLQGPLPKA